MYAVCRAAQLPEILSDFRVSNSVCELLQMRNWLFAFLIVVPSLAIAQIAPIPIGPNAGGGGGGGGGGGVSSLATTCPTTGAATGAVTLSGLLNVDLQTVTSYNVPASDCGWAVIANNAAPVGFSLVTANYASGYVFTFQNRGAGLLTLTPTAGTIDGGASATLATGNSTSVYFDGTNYWSFPGKGATPGGSSGQFQTNNGAGGFGGAAGTGSGTKVATATAAGTSGNCAKWDASGNVADAGAACGSASPSPVTGSIQYYPVWPQMATGSGAAPSTTTQYCAPFMLASAQHWDQVSVYMTTGAGSTGIQIALYSDATDANGRHYPATVLANSATIADTGSAGNLTWSLTSQA